MPINIGICDDSKEDIKVLSQALCKYDPTFHIMAYTSGASLLDDCEGQKILLILSF